VLGQVSELNVLRASSYTFLDFMPRGGLNVTSQMTVTLLAGAFGQSWYSGLV
jgi:hypothetical protein